jgi:hypothetical protein
MINLSRQLSNTEKSEILFYLQATVLTRHNSTDDSTRHRMPTQERKDLIAYSPASSMQFVFVLVPFAHIVPWGAKHSGAYL